MNDNKAKAPTLHVILMPDNSAQVRMENMNLLQMMGVSMLLMDKVHAHLEKIGASEMAVIVAAVLESQAALYQLAENNSKGN